jgi:hypothetical protein
VAVVEVGGHPRQPLVKVVVQVAVVVEVLEALGVSLVTRVMPVLLVTTDLLVTLVT